tara:strand:- start:2182 stop:4695 length:2514 start_codon:yes stop_codon:yes gene_type:complete
MGGAAGHMMHPFECPDVKTGNDLLALFQEAKNKVGSVKIDGTNVSFRLVTDPSGRKEFAGDRGSYDRLDVMGLTSANIGERWADPEHGMRSMYGLVVRILNNALNTKDPNTDESIIKPELESLGMWDNPAKFINTEYVKGKTNQVAYPESAKFLAFHGINHFYASAPKYPRQNQMARSEEMGYLPMPPEVLNMKRSKRPRSTTIQFDHDALQSLVSKVIPFAEKEGFTVVHSIPTEQEMGINLENLYDKTLSQQVTINLAEGQSLRYSIKEWLDFVQNPIASDGDLLSVRLANNRSITALSKEIYQELINNQTPLDQILAEDASQEEGKLAVDGAIIYYATLLLGADLLRSQKASGETAQKLFGDDMLNLGSHEGLVVLDRDEHPFCGGTQVKFTGEFIEKGQDSPFRQTNENLLREQNEQGQYVVMIPGGFKPPTAGHYQMINQYAQHPSVQEVIIIQGPKARDGVTNAESRAIFELYGGFPENVMFMVSRADEKTPLETAYKIVTEQGFTNQFNHNTIFSIGASSKGGDDRRVREFVNYFQNREGTLPENVQVAVPPFVAECCTINGMDLSASTMRKALANGDLEMVKMHLTDPELLKPVLKILDYDPSQKKTMMENLSLKGLYSLVESVIIEKEEKKKNNNLPVTFNKNKASLDVTKMSTKTRDVLNEQPMGLMPLEQAIITIPQQVDAVIFQILQTTDKLGPVLQDESKSKNIKDDIRRIIMDFFDKNGPFYREITKISIDSTGSGIKQSAQQAQQMMAEDELDEMRIPSSPPQLPVPNKNKKKEEVDEVSSMAGGAVEGYAGGNNKNKKVDSLIREEDLVERIIKKLASGKY